MTTTTTTDYHDIDQMRRRIREHIAVLDVLRGDQDDPRVCSEMTAIQAELTRARTELTALRAERNDR